MKKRKNTLYGLVLREYSYLLVIIGVVFFILTDILNNAFIDYDTGNNVDGLIQAIEQSNGNYQDVSVEHYIRKNGFFEIVNQSGDIVYTSKPTNQTHYTKGALMCIPELDSKGYIFDDVIKDSRNGDKRILYHYKDDPDTNQTGLHAVTITDQAGNVLYDTDPNANKRITEEDLKYLYNYNDQNEYLQKYEFKQDQTSYYIITHTVDEDYNAMIQKVRTSRYMAIMSYIVFVIVTVLLFGKRLNRRVQKPLTMLEEGMESFKQGNSQHLTYQGLSELEDICNTFNNMSDQLTAANLKQKELEEQKAKMLADISHDLKTPITVIQGYSKALNDHMIDPNDQDKYLTTIYQKSTLMEELINAFHEYARLDHPDFELNLKPVNINEFTRIYFAEKFEELELAGFDLDIDIPETDIIINIDPFQIKRVFENIISNSIKHNESGTCIRVYLKEDEKHVYLYIGDNGKGINTYLKNHIFEPFVVGETARTSGKGTGLGLSIAKKIMEAHNGDIQITDHIDCLTFQLTFSK